MSKAPKLVIIAGAGASYDSDPMRACNPNDSDRHWDTRIPLANHLFLPRFRPLQGQYARLGPIIDRLAHLPKGKTIEDMLSLLQEGVDRNRFRAAQLLSARLYIHQVVTQTQASWCRDGKINTNWMTLLGHLSDHLEMTDITLVTLNYDHLIEDAVTSLGLPAYVDMHDYISSDRPTLLKLHGSVDWYDPIIGWSPPHRLHGVPALVGGARAIVHFDSTRKLDAISSSYFADNFYHLPAIAVPVRQKLGFMCPKPHRLTFENALREATHVLTIGWRGADDHVSQMVKGNLSKRAKITAITASRDESEAVIKAIDPNNFVAVLGNNNLTALGDGFTSFLRSDAIDQFIEELTA